MKDIIDAATWRAITYNADGATDQFYDSLRNQRFQSTKCDDCGHVPFPPRLFCSKCGCNEVTWIDLPDRGTLYAFSLQQRSLRFPAPDVLGIVELEGVGLVFTHIEGRISDLEIGQAVKLGFHQVSEKITVHKFIPS